METSEEHQRSEGASAGTNQKSVLGFCIPPFLVSARSRVAAAPVSGHEASGIQEKLPGSQHAPPGAETPHRPRVRGEASTGSRQHGGQGPHWGSRLPSRAQSDHVGTFALRREAGGPLGRAAAGLCCPGPLSYSDRLIVLLAFG